MARFSENFLKSIESDYSIEMRETRQPTDDELKRLDEMDAEIHHLQDEISRLQDAIHQKRKAADAFVNQIYGVKTFKVMKKRK